MVFDTSREDCFAEIEAHEAGHTLGIGDAYGANYRFFYETPGTGNYMMCHSRRVQPEELEMVFRAHLTNRMQYFPWKFVPGIFLSGFHRMLKLKINTLSRRDRRQKREMEKRTSERARSTQ